MSEAVKTSEHRSVLASRRAQHVATAVAGAIVVFAIGLWVALSDASGATASDSKSFNTTGGEQLFTVPDGVTSLHAVAIGGRGGTGGNSTLVPGAFGAKAVADLPVVPGQILFVNVGGNGAPTAGAVGATNAFNGGGAGAVAYVGGGGGGATDIRTISRASAGNTLGSRLIIAGGGGGSGGDSGDIPSIAGGAGGKAGAPGLGGNGSNAANGSGTQNGAGGQGGTQTSRGPGATSGSAGQGGNGGTSPNTGGGGGGGGGGKFGGGGGLAATAQAGSGGGGGGGSSSFASTATSTSLATDTTGTPLVQLTYSAGGGSGLKLGKVKLNKNKGTALLPVTVPGTGDLSVGGKGVVKKRPGLAGIRLAKAITEAGTYKLKIKAKGKKKTKLFDIGKVKVKAVVTFKPSSGDAVHDTKKIKLKKN